MDEKRDEIVELFKKKGEFMAQFFYLRNRSVSVLKFHFQNIF